MLTNNSLERVLSRIPEFVDLLRRLQSPRARPSGNHSDQSYEGPDPEALFEDLADLLELLGDLAGRVGSLEQDRAAIESKVEISRAAERNWQPTTPIRTGIVFTDGVGEVVTLPRDFLEVFAAKRQLDVSEVVRDGGDVLVRDGERVVARMPASLWVVLEKVVVSCPWISGSR